MAVGSPTGPHAFAQRRTTAIIIDTGVGRPTGPPARMPNKYAGMLIVAKSKILKIYSLKIV